MDSKQSSSSSKNNKFAIVKILCAQPWNADAEFLTKNFRCSTEWMARWCNFFMTESYTSYGKRFHLSYAWPARRLQWSFNLHSSLKSQKRMLKHSNRVKQKTILIFIIRVYSPKHWLDLIRCKIKIFFTQLISNRGVTVPVLKAVCPFRLSKPFGGNWNFHYDDDNESTREKR